MRATTGSIAASSTAIRRTNFACYRASRYFPVTRVEADKGNHAVLGMDHCPSRSPGGAIERWPPPPAATTARMRLVQEHEGAACRGALSSRFRPRRLHRSAPARSRVRGTGAWTTCSQPFHARLRRGASTCALRPRRRADRRCLPATIADRVGLRKRSWRAPRASISPVATGRCTPACPLHRTAAQLGRAWGHDRGRRPSPAQCSVRCSSSPPATVAASRRWSNTAPADSRGRERTRRKPCHWSTPAHRPPRQLRPSGARRLHASDELHLLLGSTAGDLNSLADLIDANRPASRAAPTNAIQAMPPRSRAGSCSTAIPTACRCALQFRIGGELRGLAASGAYHAVPRRSITARARAEAPHPLLARFGPLAGTLQPQTPGGTTPGTCGSAAHHDDRLAPCCSSTSTTSRRSMTRFGHAAGDRLLPPRWPAASAAHARGRPWSRPHRRREFCVLLSRLALRRRAARVAERVLDRARPPAADRQPMAGRVGASIGIALYPCGGGEIDTLLKHADTAMCRGQEVRPPATPTASSCRE